MATFESTVNNSAPMDQIPKETKNSTKEGLYSTKSPSGVGIKPGIINPIPFSIQIPIKVRKHARYIIGGICRSFLVNMMTIEVIDIIKLAQI